MTVQRHEPPRATLARRRDEGGAATPRRPGLRVLLTRRSVLLACLATATVHLLALTRRLGIDEGGFAVVARFWRTPGPYLYGPQWVDRPPGLIALFAGAGHLGPYGVRLVATAVAVLLVAAVASAAAALGGRPAARWAAWTAFALSSSTLLDTEGLNGELVAATCVAVSLAALVRAVRVSHGRVSTVLLGGLAGAAATSAVLAKQNFVDGLVFAGVLLGVGSLTRANRLVYRPARVRGTAAAFAVGALLPAGGALLWAGSHGGVGALAYAMYGFRGDAAAVIAGSWRAPAYRLGVLVLVAWVSGLLFLLGHLVLRHGARLRHPDPLAWALTAAVTVELAGILAGGNFWAHYLIALIPTVALATGLSVHPRMPGRTWTRGMVLLAVLTTTLVSPVQSVQEVRTPSQAWTTGRWVAGAAAPGDSLVVPFTHANVIQASGLRPAYPYAWSLPLRTRDPQLRLLVHALAGRSAATWVVRWDRAHPWGLDPADRVQAALRRHYRQVATVCGHPVWLRDGVRRAVSPPPGTRACGPSGT